MVQTITPVVHGGRGRWGVAVGVHTLAAALVAALFGAVLGWLGSAFGAPFGRVGWSVVAIAAAGYAAAAAGWLSLPIPALRRQVPDWWRTFFPPMVTAGLYGAGLGIGFFTYLSTGVLAVVSIAVFVGGSPGAGAVLVGAFGLARGLSALTAAGVRSEEEGFAVVERLTGRPDRRRREVAALTLALIAIFALVAASHVIESDWASLANAALAITFAWAAIAKVASSKRWRRALATYELPGRIEPAAVPGVPILEATIALLALVGASRAAAVCAAVLLAGFAVVVARRAHLSPGPLVCGCFGGGRERSAASLLIRIGAIAGVAAIVLAGPPARPGLALPGFPRGGEIVAASLAVAGLMMAVALLRQATIMRRTA